MMFLLTSFTLNQLVKIYVLVQKWNIRILFGKIHFLLALNVPKKHTCPLIYLSCPQYLPNSVYLNTAVTVVELVVLEIDAQASTKAFFLYIEKVQLKFLKALLSKIKPAWMIT